jgi:hypothetical protein
MKLAAFVSAALLVPTVVAVPPRAPEVVDVRVAHDRAHGFVAGDGLVVTVAHVLDDAGAPVLVNGRSATVVRLDRVSDLALLRVPGAEGEAPRLGGGSGGASLLGRPATVLRHVNANVDGGPRRPALVLRARVTAGDSGAPVLTDSGRVAGVLFARSRTRVSTAYALDATAVAGLLRSSP